MNDCERLAKENADLRRVLEIIVSGATFTKGHDSGGWTYAHVRQASLNVGREMLGRPIVPDLA